MKKTTTLLAVGLLTSSAVLPGIAHAETIPDQSNLKSELTKARTNDTSVTEPSDVPINSDSENVLGKKESTQSNADDTLKKESTQSNADDTLKKDSTQSNPNNSLNGGSIEKNGKSSDHEDITDVPFQNIPKKADAYSIDGNTPQIVSEVNQFSTVSLSYAGKGTSLDSVASPGSLFTVSIKVVNYSNIGEVIPAGTKINFSGSESLGKLTSDKIFKYSSFFSKDDKTFSVITEENGSISLVFNSDFYPGENTSQLVLMYQNPGYNWDSSGNTSNPTIVNANLKTSISSTSSTSAIREIDSLPLYLKPNTKSQTEASGASVGGWPGPADPSMTSPGYTTDKQGSGGWQFYYIHDSNAVNNDGKPYFSYTAMRNLLVWGTGAGGMLKTTTTEHPFDVKASRLYVKNLDGSIQDITNSSGVVWDENNNDHSIKVRFTEYTKNHPNAQAMYLRTFVPVDSLMDINHAFLVSLNDGGTNNEGVDNGDYSVTSVFASPLSDSKTPYFRGGDLVVYETDRTSAKKDLYANIGNQQISSKDIKITDFDGYPDFDSDQTGTDVKANPGVYNIKYSVTSGGVTTDFTRKITVLENKSSLNVNNSTIYKGTNWKAQDNFSNATDINGSLINFDKIKYTGTVDVNTPGVYPIIYSYGDISKTINVTVVDNQETLVAKDSIIYVGDNWDPKDNFISSTDKNGNNINFSDIKTTGDVDTTIPGIYSVTYSKGDLLRQIKVTVLENKATIISKNSIIYIGDTWNSKDNFVSATDKNGNSINFSNVLVTNTVDTEKVGEYKITYEYAGKQSISTVTVAPNKASLVIKDSAIYIGDIWNSKDNFISATDKDGNSIDMSSIQTIGTVSTNKIGSYTVLYSNGSIEKLATISVLENKQSITGSDVTAHVGDSLPADDAFKASAKGKDGKDSAVTLDKSKVDMSKVGDYDVVISSKDGQTKTVTLHVLANQQSITGSDVTAYVGDSVPSDDAFKASAKDKDGKDSAVTLDKSKVDMTKAGDYDVIISSEDGQTKTVTLHVLANQQSITGSDVTAYVGDSVPSDDAFKASAQDKDGKVSAVTLDKSKVDMTKAGDYDVVISSEDGQTKTVMLHVLVNQQSITGSDVTAHVGDSLPADEVFKASAQDKDGKDSAVTLDKSKVDMTKAGDYDVVISSEDGQTKTVTLHILANQQSITGSNVAAHVGDSVPSDEAFKASAKDKDGKDSAVTLDKSKVDMTKAGDYNVVISSEDGQTKTVTVHVLDNDSTGNTPDDNGGTQTPNTPDNNGGTQTPNTPINNSGSQLTNDGSGKYQAASLPKTGDNSSKSLLAMATGIFVIALGAIAAFFKIKRVRK